MASYGIGPARLVAAAVEQFADEHGISWPRALAPFAVHLVLARRGRHPRARGQRPLYDTLLEGGIEVLYDDRDAGPGEKFADAELLGCPLRLTVGRRSLESGEIEVQVRRGRAERRRWRSRTMPASSCARWTSCGGAFLDPPRGPPSTGPARPRPLRAAPSETLRGSPCGSWTLPNAVGFVRLGLIPVFLSSPSPPRRHERAAAVLFAVIGWGDYLDGIPARVTGQYSRLGTLLDPVTDRLLIVAGVVVGWHFRAAAPLGAGGARGAGAADARVRPLRPARVGCELRINWPGRLAVAPLMARCSSPWRAWKGCRKSCSTSASCWSSWRP